MVLTSPPREPALNVALCASRDEVLAHHRFHVQRAGAWRILQQIPDGDDPNAKIVGLEYDERWPPSWYYTLKVMTSSRQVWNTLLTDTALRWCFSKIWLQIPHLGPKEPLPSHFHIHLFISLHFVIFSPLSSLIAFPSWCQFLYCNNLYFCL